MIAAQKPEAQAAVESAADSLFHHIAHGDEKHRAWLREQSLEWARSYFQRAALAAASAPGVPAGWRLVPWPLTQDLFDAFQRGFRHQLSRRKHGTPKKGFKGSAEEAGLLALLSAAPSPADQPDQPARQEGG